MLSPNLDIRDLIVVVEVEAEIKIVIVIEIETKTRTVNLNEMIDRVPLEDAPDLDLEIVHHFEIIRMTQLGKKNGNEKKSRNVRKKQLDTNEKCLQIVILQFGADKILILEM